MKFNYNKKQLFILLGIVLLAVGISLSFLILSDKLKTPEKNAPQEEQISQSAKEISILDEIDNYQEKYFEIVKRHDAFLVLENNEEAIADLKELKALFEEVKKKINKNNEYLVKYEEINKKYKTNTGNTTLEINEFASNKYSAFDKLLNEVYKEIKEQLTEEDFEKLKISQRKWLKEVEDYDKIYASKGFGTIGTLVKLDYETNMKAFRTLLLMFYLRNDNLANLDDYLGQWSEIVAGRIYLNIENKNNKIQVTHGGANSAYSHSESVYDCKFDNKTGNLICNGAKHTNQFVSCRGISSEEDLEGFLECAEKYPKEEKDDYETYSDNKTRILSLKKGSKNHFIIDDDKYLDETKKAEIRKNYENMGLYFKEDEDTVYFKYKK